MFRWTRMKKLLERPWAAYTFAICSGVVLFLFLSHLNLLWAFLKGVYYVIAPVVTGIVIAYVLDPLVKFFEFRVFGKLKRRSAARGLGVFLTFSLLVLLLTILLVAMIPQLIDSAQMFLGNLGSYARSLNKMLRDLQKFAKEHNADISQITDSLGDIIGNLTRLLPQSLNKVLDTTYNYGVLVFNLIISCIIAIYMLLDKARLLNGSKRLWKAVTNEKSYQLSNDFLGRCNTIMIRFIVFDLLDGILIGILNAIFMLIVGYPYVPLISVIVGVTNLAPTFGPIFGAVIGALILFLINPWYALGFLIFTIALQTMDGYVIKPKLFGGQLGVPSIWILIALIVFSRMWGVLGILVAIPFAAIIDFIYQDVILPRLERRKKKAAAAEAAAKSAVSHSDANLSKEEGNGEMETEENGETAVKERGETETKENAETAVKERGETETKENAETAIEENGGTETKA